MSKKEVTEAEAEDVETEEVETTEEETEDEESTEEESTDEDKSDKSSSTDEELDLDAELEKERKAGEPDPVIADKAFKERKEKREKDSDDEEADKPLTQRDLQAALEADRKERRHDDALVIARGMAGSEKEAELVVAKWANRTFPKSLTLSEQISEAYVITHSKKLIGERNEAMRALKGKQGIKKDAAGTHRDAGKSSTEPKLPPGDAAVLRKSGFSYNNVSRQFEKKLSGGKMLVRDNKTKQIRLVK